jgi:hypothetical protein
MEDPRFDDLLDHAALTPNEMEAELGWSLDYARNPARIARLTELYDKPTTTRWDGRGPKTHSCQTEPRMVLAGAFFTAGPGREQEAAEAWAFELKVYFKRGVGEQPQVEYRNGVYIVVGPIQTTHGGDQPNAEGIVWFT